LLAEQDQSRAGHAGRLGRAEDSKRLTHRVIHGSPKIG